MKLALTDPAVLKKRVLCSDIRKQNYFFEAMVLEVSPSKRLVRLMREDGGIEWGTFTLISVEEILPDKDSFGQPSPCG
jgi:hypothetical protein